jgi:hypothetical protein
LRLMPSGRALDGLGEVWSKPEQTTLQNPPSKPTRPTRSSRFAAL